MVETKRVTWGRPKIEKTEELEEKKYTLDDAEAFFGLSGIDSFVEKNDIVLGLFVSLCLSKNQLPHEVYKIPYGWESNTESLLPRHFFSWFTLLSNNNVINVPDYWEKEHISYLEMLLHDYNFHSLTKYIWRLNE